MPIIPYMGVVLPFMGSQSLDRYYFYFVAHFHESADIRVAIKSGSTVV